MPLMHCFLYKVFGVHQYSEKRNVFSDRSKTAAVCDGSRKFLRNEFQNIGPATEKARRPYVVSRWDGITRWWPAPERRCCLEALLSRLERNTQLDTGEQNRTDIGVWSVITPSLYLTRSGTSSQWSSVCIRCLRPRSNFCVPLTTRAAKTLVATCWWWSLEPQRRQRYSSRRVTSQRRARASWQTPKSVSAVCAVVDAYGRSR